MTFVVEGSASRVLAKVREAGALGYRYEKEEFKKKFGKNEFWITRAFTNNDRLTFIFLVPVDVLWEEDLIDVIIKDTPVREHDKKLLVNSLGS